MRPTTVFPCKRYSYGTEKPLKMLFAFSKCEQCLRRKIHVRFSYSLHFVLIQTYLHVFFCGCTVFRPISADAKLQMNPRSDMDFSSPKVDLTVNLSEVAFELNRPQVCLHTCKFAICEHFLWNGVKDGGKQHFCLLERQFSFNDGSCTRLSSCL